MNERDTLQFITDNLKSNKVFSEVLTITPKVAEKLLNLNWPENRKLIDSTVEKYTLAMKHGHWRLNGEPIIMSKDSIMIDGQHRLWAIMYANTPISAVVTFGVESDTVSTINCGRPRSLSFLSKIPPAQAAALNFILRLGYGTAESTATNLTTLAQVYEEDVNAITKMHSGKNLPILRQAPVTAAAAMWIHAGQGDYVREVYKSLLALDSGSLPPIARSFLQQCAAASMGAKHKPMGNELFQRAFKVFDPKFGLVKTLIIKDGTATIEQARGMIAKAMKHSGITLDATPTGTKKVAKKAIKVRS